MKKFLPSFLLLIFFLLPIMLWIGAKFDFYFPWYVVFFVLLIIDVILGAGISALLHVLDWGPEARMANKIYQVAYAFIVGGSAFLLVSSFEETVVVLILFLGYIEDVLFYPLTWFLNPVLKLFWGQEFILSEGVLPQRFSGGWIGWIQRVIFRHDNEGISRLTVFFIAGVALGMTATILFL